MSEIKIMEKPDWISYEDIHDLLYRAHETNRAKGIVMKTSLLTGEELKHRIGDRGKCFVALDGDKLVGTSSYKVTKRDSWYVCGETIEKMLSGVDPDYKGMHISSMLHEAIEVVVKDEGYAVIETNTAEGNTLMQKINIKRGFVYVSYFTPASTDHYSVVMAKWLNGCPFSKKYCKFRFYLKKLFIQARYKPGAVKRFGI